MAGRQEPNRGVPAEPTGSWFGLILVGGLVTFLLIWTYIFFGMQGVTWWGYSGGVLALGGLSGLGWRWRRRRDQRQLDVLKRWAASESEMPPRTKRP